MLETEEHLRDILMEIHTTVGFKMEKLTARESILGAMVRFTTGSGTKASSMAMEFGEDFMGTPTSGNGVTQKQKAMGFTLGRTETDTKENGSNASSMDKEPTYLQTQTFIQANIRKVNPMEKGNTHGKMDLSI